MSMDDSILEVTAKKHKEDCQLFISQPQASASTMEEELNIKKLHTHLLNKMKAKTVEISDKLKYCLPKGKERARIHFNMAQVAKHLQNNDFIMDGREKREIQQEVEALINSNAGELEISTEIHYSGPRTIDRTTSDDEYQVFP